MLTRYSKHRFEPSANILSGLAAGGSLFYAGENIPPNECESLSVKLMRLEIVSHGARSVNQSRKATVKSCADADGQQVQTGSLSTVIRLS